VANLTLTSRRIWKRFELSASVYNLFDKRYFDPGTGNMVRDQIEQDGRVFRLNATYSF
jgi:iron complex outermembrane receptor protein